MGNLNWIDMAPVRGRCQALINAVMNSLVSQDAGNFLNS